MNKYELTDETKGILHRIKALKTFGQVSKGDLGGWVESTKNLSQEGCCWVFGNARISDDAAISGDARISGNVWISDNVRVSGDARIFGNAWVSGNAQIFENAAISGNVWVSDNAAIFGNAWVSGNARISGDARIFGNVWVSGNAQIFENAAISGNARISDDAAIFGDAQVSGDADIIWISRLGSRLDTTTIFKNKDGGLSVSCGCFFGTLADFEAKVKETHSDNKYAQEYLKLVELAKIHFEQKNTL